MFADRPLNSPMFASPTVFCSTGRPFLTRLCTAQVKASKGPANTVEQKKMQIIQVCVGLSGLAASVSAASVPYPSCSPGRTIQRDVAEVPPLPAPQWLHDHDRGVVVMEGASQLVVGSVPLCCRCSTSTWLLSVVCTFGVFLLIMFMAQPVTIPPNTFSSLTVCDLSMDSLLSV
jgi:hypothetical protein